MPRRPCPRVKESRDLERNAEREVTSRMSEGVERGRALNSRIREILDYVVDILVSGREPPGSEIDLMQHLVRKGYRLRDVGEALELAFSAPVTVEVSEARGGGDPRLSSRRLLNASERSMLSIEAQGELVRLCDAGLVTGVEIDDMLSVVAMLAPEELSLEQSLLLLIRSVKDQGRAAMVIGSYWNALSRRQDEPSQPH